MSQQANIRRSLWQYASLIGARMLMDAVPLIDKGITHLSLAQRILITIRQEIGNHRLSQLAQAQIARVPQGQYCLTRLSHLLDHVAPLPSDQPQNLEVNGVKFGQNWSLWFVDKYTAVHLTGLANYYGNSDFFRMMIEGLGWTVPYTVMKCATQAGLPGKPLNILDVGCHEAGFLDALTLAREKKPDLFPAEVAAYTGLDFSASAIKQAKQKHPQHTFIHGDAVDLQTYESIPDRSQDLIICSGLCDYLLPPQINILLENLERKLAPGGKIVLTYRTTLAKYGVPEPQAVEIDSPFILKFEIEGIKFLMFPDNIFTLYYVCYPPDEFEKIIAASNLRLDLISSQSRPANNDGPPNIYDFVVLESVS